MQHDREVTACYIARLVSDSIWECELKRDKIQLTLQRILDALAINSQ
jgi:hypothetical protein